MFALVKEKTSVRTEEKENHVNAAWEILIKIIKIGKK
jgi:hypothetical protein